MAVRKATIAGYRQALRGAVRGLWSGVIDSSQFEEIVRDSVYRGLNQAWLKGAAQCGIAEEDLTLDEWEVLSKALAEEISHIRNLSERVEGNSKAKGGKVTPLLAHLSLWVNRYTDVQNQAKVMACKDKKLIWIFNPQKENCNTCKKLHNKVKRASYWKRIGLRPQNPPNDMLDCGGWECGCRLEVTDKPVSKGKLPSVRGPKPVEPTRKVQPRKPGQAPEGRDVTSEKLDEFLMKDLGPGSWEDVSQDTRARAKHELVTTLAERTGLDYEEVNKFVYQWSKSSNDEDMRSLMIQVASSEEFGIPLSDFTKGRIAELEEKLKIFEQYHLDVGPELRPLMGMDRQKRLLRVMYDRTQEKLKEAGFKPDDVIRLRRGVGLPVEVVKDWKRGGIKNIVGNPLESWSVGQEAAEYFARDATRRGQVGIVFEIDMPISSIISSARTGLGSLPEGEFVAVGSIPGEAKVIKGLKPERVWQQE